MKFCPNCGASLVEGVASFCSNCGKPLHAEGASPEPVSQKEVTQEFPIPEKVVYSAQPQAPAALAASDEPSPKRPRKRWRKEKEQKARSKPRTKKKVEAADEPIAPEQPPDPPFDDGYDQYYEDVLPIDEGQRAVEKLDPDMIKKAAMIAGGALLIILIAVIALMLM